MSDEELVAECATGDSEALGALFDRFADVVYRFAGRLARTDTMVRDDIVQATFLEIPRTAADYRGTSSVKTWILGIATNVARQLLRAERRRLARQAKFYERLPTTAMPLDEHVERRQLLGRIAEALTALPFDRQITFVLCDLEQLPCAEVARILDVPEGTVWRRLHVARKEMRAALRGDSK